MSDQALKDRDGRPSQVLKRAPAEAVGKGDHSTGSVAFGREIVIKCILALGFKRNTTAFGEELRAILPRVPRLNVAWLQDALEDPGENLQTESLESQDEEILDTSFEDLSKPKRKLAEGQQPVVLQPLKIKKLIPNPNKIRKPLDGHRFG